SNRLRAVGIGLTLFGVTCAQAQIQPKASQAVNPEILTARPTVMDMRQIMQQSTLGMSPDNNLLITGNVGGGKHFRADVPYGATSALHTGLASESLSPFFRLSQQQGYDSSFPMGYTPYYSVTATATHTAVGQPGIITPAMFSQRSNTTHFVPRQRPSSLGLTSTEAAPSRAVLLDTQRRYVDKHGSETLPEDLLLISASPDIDQLLRMPDALMQMDVVLTPDVNAPFAHAQHSDLLLQTFDANGLGPVRSERTRETPIQDPNASDMMVRSAYPMTSEIAMQAYAQTKFNTFMKAGEMYLKQGEYDKAVDAYSLASVYQSSQVLAVAGKSHALLGRRAYSSSALHLIRALNVLPDYAKTDMGLSDLMGGPKAVKAHIDRLESHAERKHVPELKLLLAFIYVQMGDVGLAQKVLEDVPPDSSYEIARVALLEASGTLGY
ncbi:MAG: hypothetical protein HQ515_19080, partial [Phycisphaeraceae bacterium]|nr:hypothetical protein [Phycisphaeraceae bacterium]